MEVNTEVTVTDLVLCPHCGQWFDATITDDVIVDIDYDYIRDDYD